jgi:hypothetical protein
MKVQKGLNKKRNQLRERRTERHEKMRDFGANFEQKVKGSERERERERRSKVQMTDDLNKSKPCQSMTKSTSGRVFERKVEQNGRVQVNLVSKPVSTAKDELTNNSKINNKL